MATKVYNRISVPTEESLAGPDWVARVGALPTAVYQDRVRQDTFGHLAPERRKVYPGYVVFTYTAWGHMEPIEAEFEGLEFSPWLFEDMNEFIENQCFDDRRGKDRLAQGQVYRWEGSYVRFNNGNFRFSGKTRRIDSSGRRASRSTARRGA